MTTKLETATKTELRILCKAAGIRGYGAMDNAKMRAALRAAARNLESDPGALDAATEARVDKAAQRHTDTMPVNKVTAKKPVSRKAAQVRAAKAASKSADQPSVREWLEARLAKGELKVADALAFAAQTGRSKVTVYRQAHELGYGARKGVFVRN